MNTEGKTRQELLLENEELRGRLAEAEETLHAIRSGAVDAVVVEGAREEALKESEERYRSLFDRVPIIGLYRTTPEGQILDVNLALVKILGYPDRETALAVNTADGYVNPEDRTRWQALMDGEGMALDFEVQWRCYDGTTIWVRESARAIHDADGRVLYYEGAVEDITERKRIEEALRERWWLERKQAEGALRESEAHLQGLFETMAEGMIFIAPDGQIVQANPAAGRILGLRRSDIEARNYVAPEWEILRPDGTPMPPEEMAGPRAMKERRPVKDVVMGAKRPDGSITWINVSAAPLITESGELEGVVGTFADITERKQAEETLQEREAYYDSIIGSLPSSLLTIDHNLRVVSANRNFLEKARRSESDTIGRRINEVFSPAVLSYSRLEERITDVFETGKPFGGGEMVRLPRLFGRVYFYRLSPLKDEKGEVKNAVLFMDDVTEQKRLSEEVRRAERHLASVVDSANDLVVSMDPEGKILTWNKAAERASGFRPGEVKGQYLPDLCVEEGQQEMGSWLTQLARGWFAKKSMEINLRTRGGEEVPISWAGSRMLDDERNIGGLVAVGRDLTERKRLEAQLIQSAKLTSLGVMAGGIAHEIRNPLAISSAAAQLLLERPDDEGLRKEAAEKIHSGIQRASYIIESLLKFARPPEEQMIPVDISEVLQETLSLLASQLRVQRVELRRDLAPELPPVVGNESLLQQVFSNMILNACNAMPDGGSLTVATRVNSDDQVEIAFADTGCGVPEEDLSKIFDPFFTTMPVGKGIGLGLSISYSITKQYQGAIEVESQVGQGSTFTIRLPGNSQ